MKVTIGFISGEFEILSQLFGGFRDVANDSYEVRYPTDSKGGFQMSLLGKNSCWADKGKVPIFQNWKVFTMDG